MCQTKYQTLFIIILVIAILGFNQVNAKVSAEWPLLGKIIYIDPGHGGRDPGAIAGSTIEKDLNLQVSLLLENELLKQGAIVYMTRTLDVDLSSKWDRLKKRGDLYRRILLYKKNNADLYLSIHMNSHSNSNMNGVEVLYNKINKNNIKLATIIMENFKSTLKVKKRLKSTDLYMYKNTTTPGVLIECGFISSSKDRHLLNNKSYQKKLANIITTSVIEYFS